eukprot:1685546-Alexandrium_andersonii.AAC.1
MQARAALAAPDMSRRSPSASRRAKAFGPGRRGGEEQAGMGTLLEGPKKSSFPPGRRRGRGPPEGPASAKTEG